MRILLLPLQEMKALKHMIIIIVINGVLLYIIANHIPALGFQVQSVYSDSIIIFGALGILFWITNSLLKGILKTLTLPIKYLTLGISGLVINVLMLYIFEQATNYADVGIIVSLGTLSQTFTLSLIVTMVHFAIKKII